MDKRQWSHQSGSDAFLISTDPSLLTDQCVQEFLATPDMYWAAPMDAEEMVILRQNSIILGLYLNKESTGDAAATHLNGPTGQNLETIGMARLVTDRMTTIFLTDVYVVPKYQGRGLGKWLMECVADLGKSTPRLRRIILLAKNEPHATRFYDELLGAKVFDQVGGKVVMMSTKMVGLDT